MYTLLQKLQQEVVAVKLEYLSEFLALAESKNYAVAAEQTFVSTSTLSRHILALEKDMGAPLFYREPQGARLTAAGQRLLPYARQIVALSDDMRRDVMADAATVTVGFVDALRQYVFLDALFRFQQENPDISLLFTENNSAALYRMVLGHECTFAFCYEYPHMNERGVQSLPLLRDRLAVALPSAHPLAGKELVHIKELKNESFIFPNTNSNTWQTCTQLMKAAHLSPKDPLFAGNSTLPMVANGLGVTLLELERNRRSLPEHVTLVELAPKVEKCLRLYYLPGRLTPAEERFLAFARNLSKE